MFKVLSWVLDLRIKVGWGLGGLWLDLGVGSFATMLPRETLRFSTTRNDDGTSVWARHSEDNVRGPAFTILVEAAAAFTSKGTNESPAPNSFHLHVAHSAHFAMEERAVPVGSSAHRH